MLFFTLIGALCLAGSIRAQVCSTTINMASGSTLSSIASAYGVSLACLENANPGPTSNQNDLAVGTPICIPTSSYCGNGCTLYTISSGNTYCSIAAAEGCANVQTLESVNSQSATALVVGSQICIPSSCTGAPIQSVVGCTTTTTTTCMANPTIVSGNTYCQFAYEYGCNVNTIEAANNYPIYDLPAGTGQTMCIPSSCAGQCAETVNLNSGNIAAYSNQYNCNLAAYYSNMNCPVPTSGTVCIPTSGCTPYNYYNSANGCIYCGGQLLNGVCTSTGYCSGNNVMYCNGNAMAGNSGMCNGVLYCNGVAQSSSTGLCNGVFYCGGAVQASSTTYCNGQYYCNGVANYNGYCAANGDCYLNGIPYYYVGTTSATSTGQSVASFAASHGASTAVVSVCAGCGTQSGLTTSGATCYTTNGSNVYY